MRYVSEIWLCQMTTLVRGSQLYFLGSYLLRTLNFKLTFAKTKGYSNNKKYRVNDIEMNFALTKLPLMESVRENNRRSRE